MKLRVMITALLAVPALALAGCATGQDAGANYQAGPDRAAGQPATTARTPTTVDGAEVAVPDGKPAAVFFFSTACGSCYEGGRQLAAAQARAGDKADFLLADVDPQEGKPQIDAFRARVGGQSLRAVSDGVLDLAQSWEVASLSTLVVVNPDGEVVFRAVDPSAQDILNAIEQAAT